MWNKCRGYVVGGVVGFIIALLVSYGIIHNALNVNKLLVSTPEKTVEVRLVTKIDTLKIPQNVYVYVPVNVPTQVSADTVFTPAKTIAMIPAIKRVYRDSVKVADSVYVGYKAHVTGTLDKVDLSYSNKKSIVVIHRTDSVFTKTTIKQYPGGLFVGVDGGYNQFTPKIEYIKNKNAFSAGYNIINKSPQIGYSRRIF
jgi:hypothetical protein